MRLRTKTVKVDEIEADCLMVDYARLKLDGWPRLTDLGEYTPNGEGKGRTLDHIRILEMLRKGVTAKQVAYRIGCHINTVQEIRRTAAANSRGQSL